MAIAKFELWLDESGNFSNEKEKMGHPSIVGGILIPHSPDNDRWPSNLVNEVRETYHIHTKFIHGTELSGQKYGEMAVNLLRKSIHQHASLVIFENEERLDIVNSDMTYLNIMAEGIIQLLQALAAEHEEIELSVLAANRIKTNGMDDRKELSLIKAKEYKERLAEKLVLGMARRNLSNTENWKWTFELDSARENHRLMLADVVCHSWFVRNGKKFTDKTREELQALYSPTNLFTVFEHATELAIRRSLAIGSIGDALFEWLDAKSSSHLNHKTESATKSSIGYEYYLQLITKKLSLIPSFAKMTQLSIVENKIKSLISIERDFNRAFLMLQLLKTEVAPKFEELGIKEKLFFFRVYLNLLQIANHRGDLNLAEEQIQKGKSIIGSLAERWETIDDVLDFVILEGVHRSNTYDFYGVIELMNRSNHFVDNSFDILSISLLEDMSILTEEMKSVIKGKILGTRLQARCFLIRQDPEQLLLARKDSNLALLQFTSKEDLSRQYQYRSQIETEANQPEEALKWLAKAFISNPTSVEIDSLLDSIRNADSINQIFGLMHYSRIMAAAVNCNKIELAELMYQEWSKTDLEDILFSERIDEHPFQIILWKQAYHLAKTNRIKAALRKYDQAIEICKANSERFTIRSIGLGMLFERASILIIADPKYNQDAKKAVKEAIKYYRELIAEELPEHMRMYFAKWEEHLAELDNHTKEEQSEILFNLSQQIPY